MILKKNSWKYLLNKKKLLTSKWLHERHIKHSMLQIAHWESTVARSKNDYYCRICQKTGARGEIINKRKTNQWRDKNWDTGVRICINCFDDEIKVVFPIKLDYCN